MHRQNDMLTDGGENGRALNNHVGCTNYNSADLSYRASKP